ncbi:hypothetical protein KUV59_08865 [Marinobacter daepoensis]|uniref:DUF6502 family protein n=1 Tax=Marinobacter daepoensis TaxID=262077 RepID=UPI001C9896D5|nr:DUF6502 family protein [Marinobacter daepoensis]MBY6033277.1 hypothetical protein [Marinobacter daepoensis]
MTDTKPNRLHQALFRILRPMARLLLRNGIPFSEFSELVKRAYVEAAFEDFADGRRKPTDSRAAVMTGLTRKEVRKQREILAGDSPVSERTSHANRASRVVSGWIHDDTFQAPDGQPAVLAFEGENSFSELVRKYSGDMTPRAILDELQRVGVVAVEAESGLLVLKQRAYVPAGDSEEMLQIFGEDVSDLVDTIDYNLASRENGQQPLFQRTLTYNGIPPEVLDEWRERAAEQSQALLEELDSWLGPHDRSVSGQEDDGESVRTGVSIFYFEEPILANKSGDDQ